MCGCTFDAKRSDARVCSVRCRNADAYASRKQRRSSSEKPHSALESEKPDLTHRGEVLDPVTHVCSPGGESGASVLRSEVARGVSLGPGLTPARLVGAGVAPEELPPKPQGYSERYWRELHGG